MTDDLLGYREKALHLLSKAKESGANAQQALELASVLLCWGEAIQTVDERQLQAQLARMMDDPVGKAFTASLTDQCFRSHDPSRIANQIAYLIDRYGIPHFLTAKRRMELKLFRAMSPLFPRLLVPVVKHALRRETARVILPGEPKALTTHLQQRSRENVRVNLNHLGEAILGEDEAQRRLKSYLDDLANPDITYISVKISTICSQLNLLDWDYTLHILSQRLRQLYRASISDPPKFVNLDMEEYQDLALTVALFKRVLDEPEFQQLSAGIVLQAYIPDSFHYQQTLTDWAIKRVAGGGAPIKIRIVKGANLAMEQVMASMNGWEQAPYGNKGNVDANFKRMVTYGMTSQHAHAVHLGIGSHNLFDIAYALLLRAEKGVEDQVTFEMLEGMADHLRRAVQAVSGDILLYCPAATAEEFQHAIAYLIRRLDENTAPQNFLRHLFHLSPGTSEWEQQANAFTIACQQIDQVSSSSQRIQNRADEPQQPLYDSSFCNEPNTDWSQASNRAWLAGVVKAWADISLPNIESATLKQVEDAVSTAAAANPQWATTSVSERSRILWNAAQAIRRRRADLMGAMIYTCGKIATEADVEIQEAIDFIEYYRRQICELYALSDISWKPKGTVLVAPPWNFPCSIPVGGIAAALATGNTVLFKPAPEAVQVGYLIAQAFWEAGVGRDVLQFIVCDDEVAGKGFIQNERVNAVILTGSTVTARHLLHLRPGLDLLAETGGKNAIIVSRMADRDLAIRDAVQSAFGHAGQKCSACSLLICEAEVYDDPHFREQLRDAASSWAVGASWEMRTKIGPLIAAPREEQRRALTTLEEGEEWLLQPQPDPDNPCLWSPGIKIGVQPGSFTHRTEFFAPLLAVMRAKDIDEAIAMANGTPYGLTSGLHSLDSREHQQWLASIEAGNLYINRGITGAVVQRQPFGGCKDSSFGPGAKAGGPHYLINLMRAEQTMLPQQSTEIPEQIKTFVQWVTQQLSDREQPLWHASIASYCYFWKHLFSQSVDVSHVIGQDNRLIYHPQKIILRMQPQDKVIDLYRVCAAALVCGADLEISCSREASVDGLDQWDINIMIETEETFAQRLANYPFPRVRLLQRPSASLEFGLAKTGARIILGPVLANGRLELLHHVREIALSYDFHRYGNLQQDFQGIAL